MDAEGAFTREYVDLFGNVAWDATRLKVQQKADEWRRQGFVGSTMASHAELSYTGIVDTLAALEGNSSCAKRSRPRYIAGTLRDENRRPTLC
jgi:fructose 1,6-bisphosphatase